MELITGEVDRFTLGAPQSSGRKGAGVLPSPAGRAPDVAEGGVGWGSVAGKGMESLEIELPWEKQGSRRVAQTQGEGPGVQG